MVEVPSLTGLRVGHGRPLRWTSLWASLTRRADLAETQATLGSVGYSALGFSPASPTMPSALTGGKNIW